ncbi:MAG TPA: hypothetical protein VKS21_09015, partial [Spirochaetota bacterium]|nr:hypothetical protein [Spirochaetota bacterium]
QSVEPDFYAYRFYTNSTSNFICSEELACDRVISNQTTTAADLSIHRGKIDCWLKMRVYDKGGKYCEYGPLKVMNAPVIEHAQDFPIIEFRAPSADVSSMEIYDFAYDSVSNYFLIAYKAETTYILARYKAVFNGPSEIIEGYGELNTSNLGFENYCNADAYALFTSINERTNNVRMRTYSVAVNSNELFFGTDPGNFSSSSHVYYVSNYFALRLNAGLTNGDTNLNYACLTSDLSASPIVSYGQQNDTLFCGETYRTRLMFTNNTYNSIDGVDYSDWLVAEYPDGDLLYFNRNTAKIGRLAVGTGMQDTSLLWRHDPQTTAGNTAERIADAVKQAWSATVDSDGYAYISQPMRNEIITFDPDGNLVSKWNIADVTCEQSVVSSEAHYRGLKTVSFAMDVADGQGKVMHEFLGICAGSAIIFIPLTEG